MELNSYFLGLTSRIEPTPEAVKTAKKAHEELREILQSDEEISKADPDTFLSGSYARHTALERIKDVDVILLIDLDRYRTAPEVVIAWLHASLQEYYSIVESQGRSVHVSTTTGFDLDVVPAVPMLLRDGPVWIPDRDVQDWVPTHPKGQIDAGVEKNKLTDGMYKPLVKIMKYWRDRLLRESSRAKSYIVEVLVAENLHWTPTSYAIGVVNFFSSVTAKYAPYLHAGTVPIISDPGYPSVNVAKRWKFQEFSDFMEEVRSALKIANAAIEATDKDTSIMLWRNLFGNKFEPKE